MKVYCIRSVRNFKKNNYYEVFIEFNDSYWIYDENYDEIKFYKNNTMSKYINDVKFDTYFMDVQKLRKEKLKKINKS
jgi:hypothetical protein